MRRRLILVLALLALVGCTTAEPTQESLVVAVREPTATPTATITPSVTPSPTVTLTPTITPRPSLTPWGGGTEMLAFASNRSGNFDLYLLDVKATRREEAETGLVRLTSHASNETEPAWSPDGLRLAFVSDRAGSKDIYVMNLDGSDLVQLTDDPANDTSPVWSPDGTAIVFVSDRDGNRNIYFMTAKGLAQRAVTIDPKEDLHPTWSPDGQAVAFVHVLPHDVDGPVPFTEVFVVDTRGQPVPPHVRGYMWTSWDVAWSPDGTMFAYATRMEGPDSLDGYYFIQLSDAAGSSRISNYQADSHKDLRSPAWSPDSRQIAYTLGAEGRRDVCWSFVTKNAGTILEAKCLTFHSADDVDPAWRPLAPAAG